MLMKIKRGLLTTFFSIMILMLFIFFITSSHQSNYFKSDFISHLTEYDSVDDLLLLMMGTELPSLKTYLEDDNIEKPDLSRMLFKVTSGITPRNFPSLLEAELPGLKSYALGVNNLGNKDKSGNASNESKSPSSDFGNLSEKDKEKEDSEDKKENHDNQKKENDEQPLSDYHFVIDPGHGGKDTGAIGTEVYEKTLTLSTAQKVEKQLRDKGASVTLTRTDDTFIPLEKRAQVSNSEDTEAFISLHYNAADDQAVNGIYTYYYNGEENGKLANSIQESLMNHVNLTDHGAKQADYKVLRDNQQLALLIELGFLTNPEEQKLIQTDSYQEKAAEGIAAGLEDYFNE